MRVRVVLAVALLAVVGVLVLEMSGSGPRMAGSNHISPAVFAAVVPGGGLLCEPDSSPPPGAADAHLVIGTYGHPMPPLELSFRAASGAVLSSGRRRAGGPQGAVSIPLSRPHGEAVQSCLRVAGRNQIAVAGEAVPPGSSIGGAVDGKPQAGRASLTFYRAGSESWWHLLPTLSQRFGLGKATFFGDWTLPAMALMLLAVLAAALRLLLRELR